MDRQAYYDWFNATSRADWDDWCLDAAAEVLANWPEDAEERPEDVEDLYETMAEIIAEYDALNGTPGVDAIYRIWGDEYRFYIGSVNNSPALFATRTHAGEAIWTKWTQDEQRLPATLNEALEYIQWREWQDAD